MARNPNAIAPAALTLILAFAGGVLGAMVADSDPLGWLIGEVRVLGMALGAAVGALWARVIVLERRIRELAADQHPRRAAPGARPAATGASENAARSTGVGDGPARRDRPAPAATASRRAVEATGPSPAPANRAPGPVRRLAGWFTEGNVPVKVGLVVLLIGVAALLRYATEHGWLSAPIELRLAGVALAAVAALLFAWRERHRRRVFAVSLQGGAIGVLALTVFAALRLYQVLPAPAAFALLIVLVATAAVLAVAQQALVLAVLALITGFAAPLLVSTGAGSHVVLFAWYAVLNLAMLGIAWHRDWPLLYRLGFAFTFVIGSAWGYLRYSPEHFASAQAFLALFFVLYFAIPVIVELRRPAAERRRVDAVLVFGLPLFWLPLEAGLFDGRAAAVAAIALTGAALYLASATWLLKARAIVGLGRAHALLAVALATVAVPFALAESTVVMIWALEGAALVWYGLAESSRFSRLAGLALVSVAMAIWLVLLTIGPYPDPAWANAAFLGGLTLALAAGISAWRYHDHAASARLVNGLALAALAPWSFAALAEIDASIPATHQADAVLLWAGLTSILAAAAHNRRPWPVTAVAAAAALALGVFAAFQQAALHEWPWGGHGAPAWLAWVLLARASRRQLRAAAAGWQALAAIAMQAAIVTMLSLVMLHAAEARLDLGAGWHWLAGGLPLLCLLAWLQAGGRPLPGPSLPEGDARRWPLTAAVTATTVGLLASLPAAGGSAPLPFVPGLNPLELGQLAALLLVARAAIEPAARERGWPGALAVAVLATFTGMALRAVHHLGDVAWTAPALLASETAQAALTVTWTVLGVLAWIAGSRRGMRGLWLAGAVVLGGVLVKLLLVDRDYLSNAAGIVSFLGFGLLSVLVGYLAPAPPRAGQEQREANP